MCAMIWQDKIDVNGGKAHPLYKLLKDKQPQDLPNSFMIPGEKGKIQWNYTSEVSFFYTAYSCRVCTSATTSLFAKCMGKIISSPQT